MSKLNEIFSSTFFQENIEKEMELEDKDLQENGWSRKEIQSIANLIIKNQNKNGKI